jgi:hypothetical protein
MAVLDFVGGRVTHRAVGASRQRHGATVGGTLIVLMAVALGVFGLRYLLAMVSGGLG